MVAAFDPRSHRCNPQVAALCGFQEANSIPLSFFEDLVVANGDGQVLRAIDASVSGAPDAAALRRHLVVESALASTGSFAAVVDAYRDETRLGLVPNGRPATTAR